MTVTQAEETICSWASQGKSIILRIAWFEWHFWTRLYMLKYLQSLHYWCLQSVCQYQKPLHRESGLWHCISGDHGDYNLQFVNRRKWTLLHNAWYNLYVFGSQMEKDPFKEGYVACSYILTGNKVRWCERKNVLCDTLYLAITEIDLHWVYDILCVLFLLAVLAFWQPRSKNLLQSSQCNSRSWNSGL